MPLKALQDRQDAWATHRWPGHSSKRAPSLKENQVIDLSPASRAEFEAASGGELGRHGKPGKMQSLRSSSALSYNVFGPWRGMDLTPLAFPLQTTLVTRNLEFEKKYRHGLRYNPPNIDVVLDGGEPRPVGIECKFMEPYGPMPEHEPLDDKYFVRDRRRWAELDMPRCQSLASSIGKGTSFRRLGAGQLLKHLLGLAYTTRSVPKLRYVWFDTDCEEAKEHRREVSRFADQLDHSIDFAAITYQDLFSALRTGPEPVPGYHSYLWNRYFSP